MSEEETMEDDASDTQVLTAEYKDGQLQIVDVASLENGEGALSELSGGNYKYMQVMDPDKRLMQLVNLTLVRCEGEGGSNSYRLVTNDECEEDGDSSTITCVLQDTDDVDEVSYVMVDDEEDVMLLDQDTSDPGRSDPVHSDLLHSEPVHSDLLHSEPGHSDPLHSDPGHSDPGHSDPEGSDPLRSDPLCNDLHPQPPQETILSSEVPQKGDGKAKSISQLAKLSPEELIRRAKLLQNVNRWGTQPKSRPPAPRRGRPRRGLPPPHELVSSPGFRLFLYSCKLCPYKCNAIKELSAHKLSKHVQDIHCDSSSRLTVGKMITLDSKEVEEADVLVCGACGFECGERSAFRDHIKERHM